MSPLTTLFFCSDILFTRRHFHTIMEAIRYNEANIPSSIKILIILFYKQHRQRVYKPKTHKLYIWFYQRQTNDCLGVEVWWEHQEDKDASARRGGGWDIKYTPSLEWWLKDIFSMASIEWNKTWGNEI